MALYKRLPVGTVTLAKLTATMDAVVQYAAAPVISGDKLLGQVERQMAETSAQELTCGIPQLDELTGGFGASKVIEISGDRGSGKTVSEWQDRCVIH